MVSDRRTNISTVRTVLTERKVSALLVCFSIIGLALRLYNLGQRVFYYDEAWFGYWTLRFLANGVWEYRPILHGPFLHRLNSFVFPHLGVSDATARLGVALIGGLLPLSAWLFRDHLRTGELVALGIALAFNPILVYYSRFMRNDLPLAAFMFVSLGLLIRAYETRRTRYLYGSSILLGLAFTTKESVLLWLLMWVGAGLLVLDRHLMGRNAQENVLLTLRSYVIRVTQGIRQWWLQVMISGGLFFLVITYFYAPRAGPGQHVGLWRAVGGDFAMFPRVVEASTIGSLQKAIDYWVRGGLQGHPYLPYLGDTLQTLAAGALSLSILATFGFIYDRYSGDSPRALVGFNFYCGVAAVVGYPLANNLPVPWSTIHAVVPLTIPAAVGAYVVYEWGRSRLPSHEPRVVTRIPMTMTSLRAGIAAAVFVYLVAIAGGTVIETNYQHPHESPVGGDGGNEIIYYAQAPGELREVTRAINESAQTTGDDVDVLYVGYRLAMNETAVRYPPATGAWHARMPLPWYTEASEADIASVQSASEIGDNPPPVVITSSATRERVAMRLSDAYVSKKYPLDDMGDRSVVVFLRHNSSSEH